MEEHNRLLYVALTRAEDRLVVCGWQTRARPRRGVLVPAGGARLRRLPAEREAFGAWDGELLRHATPQHADAASGRGSRGAQPSCRPPVAGLGGRVPAMARRAASAPSPAARSGWRPAGRKAWNWGRCRRPLAAGGARSGGQPLPPRQAGPCSVAAPARPAEPERGRGGTRLARSARQWAGRRRGRGAGRRDRWRSSNIRSSRRCSGRTAGRRCR